MKKQDTKVLCPVCGAEFAIAEKQYTAKNVTVIGKDSGLGVVYAKVEEPTPAEVEASYQQPAPALPAKALERIEALKAAGVDVSNMFAMQGANGGEYVASNKDGKLTVLDDNDPVFDIIRKGGDVPNRKLFRRWVMAQMFYMMSAKDYRTGRAWGVTEMINRKGYEYSWKMLIDEIYAQMKMVEKGDTENYYNRQRWFNPVVANEMAEHYIDMLGSYIRSLKVKKCKGVPYISIGGQNVFVEDITTKILRPLMIASWDVRDALTPHDLYFALVKFNSLRIKLRWDTPQCPRWKDSFKGAGAFFTMQNMIRFHGCKMRDDRGRFLGKDKSLVLLQVKAEEYAGEGWRLLGLMKKFLVDNGVDVEAKRREWANKR